MKKKVSVIVPIYNVEKYLEKCVESILNQSYKNIEIILVDDGATDNSGKICDKLKENNNNIIVIHKKNGGLSSARNAGIDVATGEFLSFIDSDDFIEETMYETMVEALIRTKKDIAACGRIVDVYGTHENKEFCLDEEKSYTKEETIKQILHFDSIDVSACDKLYKKELFKKIRYPEGKISEDAAVIFQIINESNGVVHVGKPFYHYVFRKRSISKSSYSEKNLDILHNLDTTKQFIEENYKENIGDFEVYACITAGAQLLLMDLDKTAKKRFKSGYKKLNEYFNYGYKNAMKDRNLSKKKRIELFCIKHKIIGVYKIIKKIYQVKYVFK